MQLLAAAQLWPAKRRVRRAAALQKLTCRPGRQLISAVQALHDSTSPLPSRWAQEARCSAAQAVMGRRRTLAEELAELATSAPTRGVTRCLISFNPRLMCHTLQLRPLTVRPGAQSPTRSRTRWARARSWRTQTTSCSSRPPSAALGTRAGQAAALHQLSRHAPSYTRARSASLCLAYSRKAGTPAVKLPSRGRARRAARLGERSRLRGPLDLDGAEYAGQATSRQAAFGGGDVDSGRAPRRPGIRCSRSPSAPHRSESERRVRGAGRRRARPARTSSRRRQGRAGTGRRRQRRRALSRAAARVLTQPGPPWRRVRARGCGLPSAPARQAPHCAALFTAAQSHARQSGVPLLAPTGQTAAPAHAVI